MLTLLVLQGPDRGKRFELPDRPALVGRERANVKLDDNTCSRRHAELRPNSVGDGWSVRDLGSSNGTWLNGQRVLTQPKPVKSGDQLRFGSTLLLAGAAAGVHRESPKDVALETAATGMDSAIVASLPAANDDSIVLAVPEPAAAAMANLKVLYQLSAALGSRFSTDQVLDVVLDLVFNTVRADRAVALLYDDAGELTPRAVRRRTPADNPDVEPIRASRTILQHVVGTGEGVVCSNAMTDRRFRAGSSVHSLGIRSAICAPVKVKRLDAGEGAGDEVLGVLYVDSSVHNYTYGVDQLRLLTAIGLQTGMALQNANLYRQGLRAERLAAVGETTAALSHSIKNILQALRGGASVVEMARARRDWKQLDKGWGVVDRNMDRIFRLTMNLLAYSKPREPERSLVNPRRVIDECVDLIAPSAAARGVVVVSDVASDQPAVPLDAEGLHQALMNLLSNGVDAVADRETADAATPGGDDAVTPRGFVRITCTYDDTGKRTVIRVADDGPGIDAGVRRHLFELFHSTKGNRGTGLGLPVAKKIVEEHGGTLAVESEPDVGTTFEISLPAFVEQADDPSHTYAG